MSSGKDYYRAAAGILLRYRLTRPCDASTIILSEEDIKTTSDLTKIPGNLICFFTRDRHSKPSFIILRRDRKTRIITRATFVYYASDLRYYNTEKDIIKRFITTKTELAVINIRINLDEYLIWSVLLHMAEYIIGPARLYEGNIRQVICGVSGCASFDARRLQASKVNRTCALGNVSSEASQVWSLMEKFGMKLYTANCNRDENQIHPSMGINVVRLTINGHNVYGVLHTHWRTLMVLLPHPNQFLVPEDVHLIKRQFRSLLRGEDIKHIVATRFTSDNHVECNSAMIAKACFLLLMMPLYTIRDSDVQAFLPQELVDKYCSEDGHVREEPAYVTVDQEIYQNSVVIDELDESSAALINLSLSGPSGEPEITVAESPVSSQAPLRTKAIEPARVSSLKSSISAGQAMMQRLAEIHRSSGTSSMSSFVGEDTSPARRSSNSSIDVGSPDWGLYSNINAQSPLPNIESGWEQDEPVQDAARCLSRRTSRLSVDDVGPGSSQLTTSSQSTIICFEEAMWLELAEHEKREDLSDAMGSLIPPIAPMKPKNDRDGLLHSIECFRDNLKHIFNCASYFGSYIISEPLKVDELRKGVAYADREDAKFIILPVIAADSVCLIIIDKMDDETGELTWGFMDPKSRTADDNIFKMRLIGDYIKGVSKRADVKSFPIQLQNQFHFDYPKIHLLLGIHTMTRYFKYVKRVPPRTIYNERDFREYCYRLCQDLAIANNKYNLAHHLVRESGYLKSDAFTSLPSPVKFVTCPVKSDQCPFCFCRKFRSLSSHMIMEHGGLAKRARAHRGV